MTQYVSRYDNLVAILVIGAVLAMLSMVSQLINNYGNSAVLKATTKPKVLGYTRPQARPQQALPRRGIPQPSRPMQTELAEQGPIEGLSDEQNSVIKHRFEQAAALLHARQYGYAITALDQVLEIVPNMPEAYVNIGYAYLGLEQYETARRAFEQAIELRADQANAYYGLASAWDGEKDYEAALGAMRTYIHLSPPTDPFLAKARAAIWEWEGLLGRIPGVQEAPEGAEPQIRQRISPHGKPPGQEPQAPSS